MLQVLNVDDLYLRQFDAFVAFEELDKAVLTRLGILPGLGTGRCRSKKDFTANRVIIISHSTFLIPHICKHDSSVSGVIARHGILLFVGGLVLLVDDDEAEALERQEDGTAGSEDNVVGIGRELFLPYFYTLCIAIFGVVDAQTTAKDTLQAFHHLYGKGNLRQEVEHLLMTVEGLLYKMDVYLRLTTGGNTVKQGDILFEE